MDLAKQESARRTHADLVNRRENNQPSALPHRGMQETSGRCSLLNVGAMIEATRV